MKKLIIITLILAGCQSKEDRIKEAIEIEDAKQLHKIQQEAEYQNLKAHYDSLDEVKRQESIQRVKHEMDSIKRKKHK